jgi:uncharacterized protein YciW
MDRIAGLTPADDVYQTRRMRPEFVDGAEASRVSVLTPEDRLGLETDLRLALACRIARLNADPALFSDYQAQLQAYRPSTELVALAEGKAEFGEPFATIVRHVDLVTLTPSQAVAADIERLAEAGLSNPQIVALSELIAFVNFQTRVAAGLRLMRVS